MRAGAARDANAPLGGIAEVRLPVSRVVESKGLDRRPAAHLDQCADVLVSRIDKDTAAAGNRPHQLVELPQNRIEIPVYICVIELDVIQNQGVRAVVNEFRSLVEKRSIVFVGLDHEALAGAEPRGDAKVGGYSAYQEAGLESRVFKNPGEHACCRRLAVSSRDREDVLTPKHVLGKPLWAGLVGDTTIQHGLDNLEPPTDDVTDHDTVGRGIKLPCVETLVHIDIQFLQLRTHGRIRLRVATGHAMAAGLGEGGYTPHESAANSKNMYVHSETQDAGVTAVENAYCKRNTPIATISPTYQGRSIADATMWPFT